MLQTKPRNRLKQKRAVTKTQYYPLEGGLDVVTPALSIKPGKALAMPLSYHISLLLTT